MTDAELVSRLRANIVAYKQFQAAQGSLRALALPGVWAFSQPASPQTPQPQLVFFEDGEALHAALAQLEDFYRSQHIPRWRVQVLPGHEAAERVLARAGFQRQEVIPTMGLSLADTPRLAPAIALEPLRTQEELIPLNAEAFGPGLSFQVREWHTRSHPQVHPLGVREGGRLLACGMAYDVEDTAGIYLVATASQARGRGLATEVMRGLLSAAHARGRAAAVLQSTEQGHGVYQRLGFRDLGAWVNWVSPPG